MLIDSHCHLFLKGLRTDILAVIERAHEMGVERMICVGIDLDTSRKSMAIADRFKGVYAAAGVHPHDAKDAPADYRLQLEEILMHPKVVAVGETGLDYYRNLSDPEIQKRVFVEQIELAETLGKPFIFHNRRADSDVLMILRSKGDFSGVAHCFSSDLETAQSYLNLGLYISFAGNLTYDKSKLPQVAVNIPLDRIMVETDAPFLSPVPYRGKENEPGRTRLVAEKLAELHELPFKELANIIRANTEMLFKLPENY